MRGITILFITSLSISSGSTATCREYFGGKIGVHWYNCCNNCNDFDRSCDGVTWQGGSSESYCGSCGAYDPSDEPSSSYYNCVDCDTQRKCAKRMSYSDIPGFCWKWSNGFAECCDIASSASLKRQTIDIDSANFTFCGDGSCQEDEAPESCPVDCCYQVNSKCGSSECVPSCCGESTCCNDGAATLKTLPFGFLVFMIFLAYSNF